MPAFFVINLQKKVKTMQRKNKKSGQGLVEYALIIGLIAIVAVAALGSASATLKSFYFDTIPNALNQIPNN